jgi:predicted amidophosphoribosyltransferase
MDCQRSVQLRAAKPLIYSPKFQVYAATGFSVKLKQRLYGYKFYQQQTHAQTLSEVLMQFWERNPQNTKVKVSLIPIPPHQEKSSHYLSSVFRPFASQFGYAYIEHGLTWARSVERQHTLLSRKRRKENMNQAFLVSPDALQKLSPGQHVLVGDDIMTTGSTMLSALNTLHTVRPDLRLTGLVLTHVPLRGQS